jgi:uncharacterized protein (TIGR02284 family)
MSTDARVTKDLIHTLEDGKEGFARAAERLRDSDRPDLSDHFDRFSSQRDRFAKELQTMAAGYGDQIDDSGTVVGTLHRGWMAVKDAVSGNDAVGVLDAAEQGEDHALTQYRSALDEDISIDLRTVVERQFGEVQAAHDTVRSLRDAKTS